MRRLALGFTGVLLVAACSGGGGGGGTNPNAVLQTITLSPAAATTLSGAKVEFTASGHFDDGSTRDVTATATWSASPGSVATFPADAAAGRATALLEGVATVKAAVGAVEGTAQLTVAKLTVVSVRVAPTSATVGEGATVALRCIGRTDANADVDVDVTALAAWHTSDPLVATVAAGSVKGVKAGQADVAATFIGLDATPARVTVLPASLVALALDLPPALSLPVGYDAWARAYARYSDGTQREMTALASWSSSSAGVVSVSDVAATRGRLDAVAPGAGRITASLGGKSASADVTVVPDSIVLLLVEPEPYPLPAGVSAPLRATALHADGTSADVTAQASWTSNADVVQVSAAGVATTIAPGVAVVEATYAGLTGTTGFLVTGAAVSRLRWSDFPVSVAVGGTYAPDVWLQYADGSYWAVGDQIEIVPADFSIAVVEHTAWGHPVVRGIAAGSTTLEARYAGQTTTIVLDVTAAVAINLYSASTVPVGLTIPVLAQAWVPGGTGDVTELAEWSSSAPQVISVSNAAGTKGKATAVASAGSAVVTATFAGMTAARTISAAGAVQSIAVSPASLVLGRFSHGGLSATATVAGGQQVDVTDIATWWCDGWIAECRQNLAYAGWPGTTPVTAAVGNVLGQGSITVVDEPDGLAIRPEIASAALPVGHSVQLSAVDTWQSTSPPRERPALEEVTWASQKPSVADFLDPARPGLLTGVAPGFTDILVTATTAVGTRLTGWAPVSVDVLQGLTIGPIAVAVGGSTALAATGTFAGRTGDVLPFVTWEIADATVLGVTPPLAYGRKVGLTDVTAHLGALSATVTATVTPPVPAWIRVDLDRTAIEPGETLAPKAYLVFDSGDVADVTGIATWSSASGATASIAGTPPVADALAAGTTRIEASWGGLTGGATLTVAVPSISQLDFYTPRMQLARGEWLGLDLNATGPLGGTIHPIRPATATSSDPTVATVTPSSTGVSVLGESVGSTVVTATWAGKTAVAVVDVVGEIGDFWLGFAGRTTFPLHVHERIGLRAVEYGDYGTVTDVVAWTSSAPAVVKVGSPGRIEAVGPGVAYVTATAPRSATSMAVPVAAAAVASVGVAGAAPMVPVGAEYACRASARFDDGASLLVTDQVTWWSADEAIAAFDPARPGVLVGRKAGVVRAEARIDGKVGATDVTVF